MNRAVHTIFCDDIRHEINGKVSYIGVYSESLLAPVFPITLPKLCISLKVTTPSDHPFRKLVVRVLRDDDVLSAGEIDKGVLVKTGKGLKKLPKGKRDGLMQVVQAHLVFSPLKLDGPCTLRVRVDTEDGELKGLGLMAAPMPSEHKSGN